MNQKSLFNTSTVAFSSTTPPSVLIPSNLHLFDPSAVLPSVSKPLIPAIEYLFPKLNVPKTIKVALFNTPGSFADVEAPINETIFGMAIRKDLVHEVIRYQRHKVRQPKKTRRMKDMRGSNKKPRPQKGMGYSQVGNRRNSAWVGGFKAHGPVIRDYSIGMNRKVRALGFMSALAAKHREGNLLIVDQLFCDSHKTKGLYKLLEAHGLVASTALFVDAELDKDFELACRNIPRTLTLPQRKANVYDIVKKEKLVLSVSALAAIQERLLNQYNYAGKRKTLNIQKTILEEAYRMATGVGASNNRRVVRGVGEDAAAMKSRS